MSDTKYFREVMEIEEYEYTAGPPSARSSWRGGSGTAS